MARQKSDTFKRNIKGFDSNFDEKTVEYSGNLTTLKTLDEAKAAFGNDESKILDALNSQFRESQINAAKQAKLATAGLMEERYIMGFIKPMRLVVPFAAIEDEKEQTKQILAKVKSESFLLEMLQSYCATRAAEGDEDSD